MILIKTAKDVLIGLDAPFMLFVQECKNFDGEKLKPEPTGLFEVVAKTGSSNFKIAQKLTRQMCEIAIAYIWDAAGQQANNPLQGIDLIDFESTYNDMVKKATTG